MIELSASWQWSSAEIKIDGWQQWSQTGFEELYWGSKERYDKKDERSKSQFFQGKWSEDISIVQKSWQFCLAWTSLE